MRGKDNARTGGEILIDQLSVQGVRHAFCVPGESYLAALDAFYGSNIELTVCRHESAAAIMLKATANINFITVLPFFVQRRPRGSGLSARPVSTGFCQPYVQVVKWLYRDNA